MGFRLSRALPALAVALAGAVAAAPAGARPSMPAQDQTPTVVVAPDPTDAAPQECPPGTTPDPTAVPTAPDVIVFPTDANGGPGAGPQDVSVPATPLTCVPAMEQTPTPMDAPVPQPTSTPPAQATVAPPAQPTSAPATQAPPPMAGPPQQAAPSSAMPPMPAPPMPAASEAGGQPAAAGLGNPPVEGAGAAVAPEVATLAAPVACPNPRLATRISGPRTVAAGGEAAWRITVRNRGRLAATDVALTYRLPAGFSLARSSPRAVMGSGVLRFGLHALRPGGAAAIRLTLHAGRGLTGRRVQQAQVLSSCGASQMARASITVTAVVARVAPAVTG